MQVLITEINSNVIRMKTNCPNRICNYHGVTKKAGSIQCLDCHCFIGFDDQKENSSIICKKIFDRGAYDSTTK